MADGCIELIARGVLIGARGVLLCRAVGKDYTYLPGGHIESGETATNALQRELQEEIGLKVKVDDFLGAVECIFTQDNQRHHEINLVFQMSSPIAERRARFAPLETHIEYLWQPINALTTANLLPRPLCALIPQWSRGKHMPWSSDIKD